MAQGTQVKGNKKPLIILAGVVVLGIIAIFFASNVNPDNLQPKADVNNLPREGAAPALDASLGWLNTDGYTEKELKDKVVVYDFWTYSCVNCQRTAPYLRALWDRYEDDGLVLIGIHSPEFSFEKDHENVEDATEKYKINYPVLFDDNKNNWRSFENQYWPAKYIADKTGEVRYHHYGEGRYEETEDVIRKLLDIDESAPRAVFPNEKVKNSEGVITPEIYINPVRGDLNVGLGKSNAVKQVTPDIDNITLAGDVDVQIERSILVSQGSKLLLKYRAGEVNIVAAPLGENGTLEILLDGKPIPKNMRGDDIEVDAQGNTVAQVASSDLLSIIESDSIQTHTLTFIAQTPNIALFTFTFGR